MNFSDEMSTDDFVVLKSEQVTLPRGLVAAPEGLIVPRAHGTAAGIGARMKFLRQRASLRQCVSSALAEGYVIDPDHRRSAKRDLLFAIIFGFRHHRTPRLIPVSADFAFRHQKLIDRPRDLWALATAQEA